MSLRTALMQDPCLSSCSHELNQQSKSQCHTDGEV